ncbi:hypothetical protein [Nonomuraea dietziae]|uniref:Uncharacterized protein n=1 Tax=Nonomuraea dietziae TaxID=65515 RepID=A0A7W5VPK7_9ACTN|nr:hypothetical protein [Nonomuraea dietziae]MBB3731972.1 hypothetical protein [Nonomuraea dietziae]
MIRKFTVSTVTALGLAVATLPAAAHAGSAMMIGDCEKGVRSGGGASWAYCNSGSGYVRAWADCWNPDTFKKVRYYGSWVEAGATSIASCNASYPSLGSYGYSTKS